MGWGAIVLIALIISFCMESAVGKAILAVGLIGVTLWLISRITGAVFLITLAKACAVTIIIIVVGVLLVSIFTK